MRAFVCLMVLWLSSCTTLDVGTVLAHRNTSAEDFDPRTFRTAILIREDLHPYIELGIGLSLSYSPPAEQAAEAVNVTENFTLAEMDEPLTGQRLSRELLPRVVMFGVAEEDLERALVLRRHAIAAENSERTDLSLLIAMSTPGANSEAVCQSLDERIQVFFRPSDAYRFRPVFKNRTPRQILGDDEACDPTSPGAHGRVQMERTP